MDKLINLIKCWWFGHEVKRDLEFIRIPGYMDRVVETAHCERCRKKLY